jgi:hypothetical protein
MQLRHAPLSISCALADFDRSDKPTPPSATAAKAPNPMPFIVVALSVERDECSSFLFRLVDLRSAAEPEHQLAAEIEPERALSALTGWFHGIAVLVTVTARVPHTVLGVPRGGIPGRLASSADLRLAQTVAKDFKERCM